LTDRALSRVRSADSPSREWPTPSSSPAPLFEAERELGFWRTDSSPNLGIALSGGGNRSAAFSMGVLQALHESGRLKDVDVISAVSGGSYTLSWYLLQQFYAHCASGGDVASARIDDELFDPEGRFQTYVEAHATLGGDKFDLVFGSALSAVFDGVAFNALRLFTALLRRADAAVLLNVTSARREYREGIQRAYQLLPGADGKPSNAQEPFLAGSIGATQHLELSLAQPPVTFPEMRDFASSVGLPGFVFNATVRPPRPGGDEPLGQRIFELGSAGLGSDSGGYLTWEQTEGHGWEPGADVKARDAGFKAFLRRRTNSPFATVRSFNNASAVCGAALSGTNLTQAAVRRGLWLMNYGLEYAVPSLATPRKLVRLSDGGHSENLGVYALLRRGCRQILVVDAEFDPHFRFPSYRRLKEASRAELGLVVRISTIDDGTFSPSIPVCVGTVSAEEEVVSTIWYLKLSMDRTLLGDQASIVDDYVRRHHDFPQESTVDQYFEPPQFRAYRALGRAIGRTIPAAES
jgi:hypothetical protein